MDLTSSTAYPAFAKPASMRKAATFLAIAAYFCPQSIIEGQPNQMLPFVDSKPAQDRLKPRHWGAPH
jgi:hypothetical protein